MDKDLALKNQVSDSKIKNFFKLLFGQKGKWIFLIGLILTIILIQCSYCFHVVPLQSGWWQYYAWQITEGEVLYKDIYCFLQPYFVWFMALLYNLFGSSFIAYLIVGITLRVLAMSCVYLIFCKKFKPIYSFIAILTGFCVSISYKMDMAFDYNTIIIYMVIFTTYFAIKAYETENLKTKKILIGVVGALSGIHFMIKQSSGIIVPVLTACLFFFLDIRKKNYKETFLNLLILVCGALVTIVPGYLVIIFQGALPAYIDCIFNASGAKISGVESIFNRFFNIMFIPEEFFISLLSFLVLVCIVTYRWLLAKAQAKKVKKILVCALIIVAAIIVLLISYAIVAYLRKSGVMGELFGKINYLLLFIFFFILLSFTMILPALKAWQNLSNRYKILFWCIALLTVIGLISFVLNGKVTTLNQLYNLNLFKIIHVASINVSFYFVIFIIIFESVYYLINKECLFGKAFYIFTFISFALVLTTLLSAKAEELTAMPTISCMLIVCLNPISIKNGTEKEQTLLQQENVEKKDPTEKITIIGMQILKGIKQFLITIVCFVLIIGCVSSKKILPYSWHGWRVETIQSNAEKVDINGLEGYYLSPKDKQAYEEIIRLILENTTEEDYVYQFPNIPLFNVLTKRKIPTYAPIHYWDVCPDNVVENCVQELYKNPPKMIIWADLSKEAWDIHELYFREGKASGQRKVLEFYLEFVQNNYQKLGQFYGIINNVEVWLLNS